MKTLLPILFGLFLLPLNANAQWPGNALDFDGVDDYVDCPLPPLFNAISNNDFTVELWVNPDLGSFERLFFAQFDTDNFVSISLSDIGEVVFYLSENGTNHSVQSLSVMNSLEWTHVAVTWSSSTQEVRVFMNGNETPYASGLFVSSTGIDGKMTFGSKTDGTQNFNGMMDELAIWSVAKSECEISFEMNDKKIGSEPNIIGSYIFDMGVPGGVNTNELISTDLALPYEDGTLVNFALNGSTSNWIESYANLIRLWGNGSQVIVGQLGLVSTIAADDYQWIYCSDLSPVPGGTNITFDPPTEDPNYTGVNDVYAVISTKGNCIDTSDCYIVNSNVSIDEVNLEAMVSIYPNPSQGIISIESSIDIELIEVRTITGELIKKTRPNYTGNIQFDLAKENGMYLVVIHTQRGLLTKKVLVQGK